MTKHPHPHRPVATPLELDGGLAELRGDCARMAPHWTAPVAGGGEASPEPARIGGLARITVPAASAELLKGTAEYGD
ncbi:hypothetical protein ACFQLX_01045 [Streptomyces polyrhachis]|uniref:Uncharacterized protein n=1 Tax=Streptomyces polyrhachis TaxID=1282885 RepID=A0ABW2GBX2_9ACTN